MRRSDQEFGKARGRQEEFDEETECEYRGLVMKVTDEVTAFNTQMDESPWTREQYEEAMLYMTRLPVAMVPAILEIEVSKLRMAVMKLARVAIAVTANGREELADGRVADHIITSAYIKGIFATVAGIIARMMTELTPREQDGWKSAMRNHKGKLVEQWKGITPDRMSDQDFWTNGMHQYIMKREMRNAATDKMDLDEMNRYHDWDPTLPVSMVWRTMRSTTQLEGRERRPWTTKLNAIRIKIPACMIPSMVAKIQRGEKLYYRQRAWAELREQEQIAAGLNRTGKKESRAMESTRIVGSKMDMKADVGIGEIMARMEVATMMKKYEDVKPDEIKGKVWWSTHNGEEPIGVKAKNAHVKSTTWAKPLKLPLEVTMYMKLQLPKCQGETDPAEDYEGIEDWPIQENVTENMEYDTIGSNGGNDPQGALYGNTAYSELADMIPKGTDCRVAMYKERIDVPIVTMGRKDKPMQEVQWEDALSLVRKLGETTVEEAGGREKSVEEAGTTLIRMKDMGGVGDRAGFDNAKLWTLDKGPFEQCNEWKAKRERKEPRKWQAPYDQRITLQEVAGRDVDRLF